jgi:hypothetical protein
MLAAIVIGLMGWLATALVRAFRLRFMATAVLIVAVSSALRAVLQALDSLPWLKVMPYWLAR